jgi:hypothetical protein
MFVQLTILMFGNLDFRRFSDDSMCLLILSLTGEL